MPLGHQLSGSEAPQTQEIPNGLFPLPVTQLLSHHHNLSTPYWYQTNCEVLCTVPSSCRLNWTTSCHFSLPSPYLPARLWLRLLPSRPASILSTLPEHAATRQHPPRPHYVDSTSEIPGISPPPLPLPQGVQGILCPKSCLGIPDKGDSYIGV